jgi:hypothetical protein
MKKAMPIGKLTDRELHMRLREFVSRERTLTLHVVDHLIEVARRRLYAVRGFSSLFTYCTGDLGYSNAAAARRVGAARTIERFPRVRGMLARRELSLSTLALISGEMRAPDAGKLIDAIKGKSRREAEATLAAFRGPVVQRERIRAVMVAVPRRSGEGAEPTQPGLPSSVEDTIPAVASRVPAKNQDAAPLAGADLVRRGPDSGQDDMSQHVTRAVIRRMYRFEFAGDTEFYRKYERAAALLSSQPGAPGTIEHVMNRVFDVFLEQRDPARREARRQKRRERARAREQVQP